MKAFWEWLGTFGVWIFFGEIILIVGMLGEIYFGCEFFQRSGAFLVLYAILLAIFKNRIDSGYDATLGTTSTLTVALLGSQLKSFILYFLEIDRRSNGFVRSTDPKLEAARENIKEIQKDIRTDSDSTEKFLTVQYEASNQLKIFEGVTATIGTIIWAVGDLLTKRYDGFCAFM